MGRSEWGGFLNPDQQKEQRPNPTRNDDGREDRRVAAGQERVEGPALEQAADSGVSPGGSYLRPGRFAGGL